MQLLLLEKCLSASELGAFYSASRMEAMPKSIGTPEHDIMISELANMRSQAGFSQRELAAALRVSPSWVAKVEIGERRIDLVEFCWWCRALGQDPAKSAQMLVAEMLR